MTEKSMSHLIAEAAALGGGDLCASGHDWEAVGGRRCPRIPDDYEGGSTQVVYECRRCGVFDYGEPGGPAHSECFVHGPCDLSCEVGT